MSGRIFHILPGKWCFTLLFFAVLVVLSPRARATGCTGVPGGTITFPDIIIDPSHASQGGVLYESGPLSFQYSCANNNPFGSGKLTLKYAINGYQSLAAQLKNAGLTMQINLTSFSSAYYNITEVADFASFFSYAPGVHDVNYITSPFRLRIVKNGAFTGAAKISFPAVNNLVSVSLGPGTTSAGLNASAFYVESIPSCFGRVEINPSTISFGHVYNFQQQINKQVSFTVTAHRDTGCLASGVNDSYDWFNLYSTFTSGNALTDGNRSLLLTDRNGTLNGLKLSLQDESATPVSFSTSSTFGKLWKDAGSNNASLTRRYTARLNLTGQPLVTGPFSADVVVTITYQ